MLTRLIALCLSLFIVAPPPERTDSPAFKGDSLPLPPQQNAAWEVLPNTLPQELVNATKLLFEQGLADPRGCEYREIEVLVGRYADSPWGSKLNRLKTHGW